MLTLAEQSRGHALMLFHTCSGEPDAEAALEAVLATAHCLFETDAVIKRQKEMPERPTGILCKKALRRAAVLNWSAAG